MVKRLSGEREEQGNGGETSRRKRMARKWWRDFQEKENGKEKVKGLPGEREEQEMIFTLPAEKKDGKDIVLSPSVKREEK